MNSSNSNVIQLHKTPKVRFVLTRRGRIAVATLITFVILSLIAVAALLGAAAAGAQEGGVTNSVAGSTASTVTFETIVAIPGDTLWSIATEVAPKHDPREVIDEIVRLNQLPSSDLMAGQEIAIPLRFSNA